jgi:hypothetical protein
MTVTIKNLSDADWTVASVQLSGVVRRHAGEGRETLGDAKGSELSAYISP